jgi:hypothetical protein
VQKVFSLPGGRREGRLPLDLRTSNAAGGPIARRPAPASAILPAILSNAAGITIALAIVVLAAGGEAAGPRVEDFRREPRWEGHRNRLVPDPAPLTRQDFGHRASNRAGGKEPGEIGGWVKRSIRPAWYAKVIPERTFRDRLSASGKLAVTRAEGGSGALFGWFHESSRGWRTPNSLTFRIAGNGGSYWVFYEYGTSGWLTGGGGCFEGPRYQDTKTKPFAGNGSVHEWSLAYDPEGAGGAGEMVFAIDGKEYRQELAPGHKLDGAVFNRFGLFNQQSSGDGLELYFDDLVLDGKPEDLRADPGWEGRGNRVEFEDRVLRPRHDFGWSATRRAGGEAGEIGGIVWRDEEPAYYAGAVGPLNLGQKLTASGKVSFTGAGSDSGVWIGWFDAGAKKAARAAPGAKDLLGILIEGPSRIGHYFRAGYRTASGDGVLDEAGPIMRPDGAAHEWSMTYDPDGAGGRGRITVTLDGESRTLDLAAGHKENGASFDRFGIFNLQVGGLFVEFWLDDLAYTAEPAGG